MLTNDLRQELEALLPGTTTEAGPSRRIALKAALGVGYAAATLPIMAQTAIKTPSDGLVSGEVVIDVDGFKMPAYRSAPAGKTGLPVVLVVSEIFGVHEYIADTARRLARAGYLAIAPELFERQGDAQSYGEVSRLLAEVIDKVPDAQVMGDLDAAVKWAAANGGGRVKAWRHRLLLGRTSNLALQRPQQACQGRGGLVWAPHGGTQPTDAPEPHRCRPKAGRAGAGSVRRGGHRHSAGFGGEDEGGARGRRCGGQGFPVCGLSGRTPRFSCRLSPQLQEGSRGRRVEACVGLVQGQWRGLKRIRTRPCVDVVADSNGQARIWQACGLRCFPATRCRMPS